MRALTICQPYAELIAHRVKLAENRTWFTSYRGPLAIHAGKNRNWLALNHDKTMDVQYGIAVSRMAFGAVIATATLVDCLHIDRIHRGEYDARYPWLRQHVHAEGPFCWVLTNVQRLAEPVPYKGAQGLFDIPDELLLATAK